MGLLDFMSSDDPQTQGLLGAAMGLLNASGPSRTPIGTGQAMAQGMMGYQHGMQSQQDRALRQLQMRHATLGLQKTETDLAKQKRLEDAYRDFNSVGAAPASSVVPSDMQASSASPMDNPAFPRQPMPDWMLKALPQGQVQAPAAQQPATGTNNYTRHLQFAQFLEGRGQGEEAAKYYDLAEKFRPRIKEQKVLMQGGKPVTVNVYEDGRTEVVPGFAPAEKLSFHNTGGQTVGVDPFTGKPVASMKNTQSPDSVASNGLGYARLNFERGNADRLQHVNVDNQPMTFNPKTGRYDAGIGPDGKPLPQTAKPLTEAQSKDNLFGTRMQEADKTLSTFESQGITRPGNIKTLAEQTGRVMGLGFEGLQNTLSDTAGSITNWTQSPQQQQVEQARRDFLNAVLRKESGAAISPSEFTSGDKQYFPQVGDSPSVLAQKALNRKIAIQGVLSGVPGGSRMKALPAAQLPDGWSVTEK
jgi:hypothetical protein